MKNYEVTFVVDPVLSGDEIKSTAATYETLLKDEGCTIIHFDDMGLKTLAYTINKRSSGFYYCIEFSAETGAVISKLELALRRDERIMRFLSIALDKYGVKYNEDKRNGLIGKVKRKSKTKGGESTEETAAAAPAAAAAPSSEKTLITASAVAAAAAAAAAATPDVIGEEE